MVTVVTEHARPRSRGDRVCRPSRPRLTARAIDPVRPKEAARMQNGGGGGASRPLSIQTVVITGATSGTGRGPARPLAGRGARVVLTARRRDALDALARRIGAEGGQAIAVPAEV